MLCLNIQAQPVPGLAPRLPAPAPLDPNQKIRVTRKDAPGPDDIVIRAVSQEVDGNMRLLKGAAQIETTESLLKADEVEYNADTGDVEARGHVEYISFHGGEVLKASRAEYNVLNGTGKFYDIEGSVPAKVEARPGVLTTSNPFVFQGRWAERLRDRYVLYDGFITSCKLPKPWWVLRGPKFDIVPGERAITTKSVFWLKKVPLFYTPYFYKSLAKQPRRSGFLTPNFARSTRRGWMYGAGYYWAINRSHDLLYRAQYFTRRGFAHTVDFRGKPWEGSDFNLYIYGVNDRGLLLDDGTRRKAGGFSVNFVGESRLGRGWTGKALINYLSAFSFRQEFTETFNEAIFSEVNSVAFATKHWSSYGVNVVFERFENFQSTQPDDKISIRKLPEFQFVSRDRRFFDKLPFWFSIDSAAGAVRRNQPLFQTRQFVERLDVSPRVMTALHLGPIHLAPSLAIRETYYGSQVNPQGRLDDRALLRSSQEAGVDLILPSLAKTFTPPKWMGQKAKHVIETRATYRYVRGIEDFNRVIRFDATEILSNTNEVEVSVTNRLYTKRGGQTNEWLAWQVWQSRYFDPTFGGAVIPGQRNIVQSTAMVSPFSFLDGPRDYSPVVSSLRMTPLPGLGTEWRLDYDPMRSRIVNSSFTADGRVQNFFLSAGHSQLRSLPSLSPPANQIRGLVGWGRENRRGWNAAFLAIYDYRIGSMQYTNTQLTYNSDCCGLSIQYRRFNFGTRFENQFRVAFAIANIASVGTLRRQERFF